MAKKDDPIVVSGLGIDPGYGNTTVRIGGTENAATATIQSAVSVPKDIAYASIGGASVKGVPEVRFDGQRFSVGKDSWLMGRPSTSMNYIAFLGAEKLALIYAALAEALSALLGDDLTDDEPADDDQPTAGKATRPVSVRSVVVGLPVALLMSKEQARPVLAAVRALAREHKFTYKGRAFCVNFQSVQAVSQPVGALTEVLYDDKLHPVGASANGGDAERAVLDLGANTLDLVAVNIAGGKVRITNRFLGGSDVGVKRLIAIMAPNRGRDHVELDALLRAGKLRATREQLEAWQQEVMAEVERTWGNDGLSRFDEILLVGGGVLVLGGERLSKALEAGGARRVVVPPNPLEANASGFWKLALTTAPQPAAAK